MLKLALPALKAAMRVVPIYNDSRSVRWTRPLEHPRLNPANMAAVFLPSRLLGGA
jgi:hypothetical protein